MYCKLSVFYCCIPYLKLPRKYQQLTSNFVHAITFKPIDIICSKFNHDMCQGPHILHGHYFCSICDEICVKFTIKIPNIFNNTASKYHIFQLQMSSVGCLKSQDSYQKCLEKQQNALKISNIT